MLIICTLLETLLLKQRCLQKKALFCVEMVLHYSNVCTSTLAFALAAAYPNPFRNSIKIAFDVPSARGGTEQQISINVYDFKGSIVQKLVNSKYAAGHYTVNWDGTGEHCALLSSSMYIVQMKADNYSKKLKLFRLK